MVVTSDDPASVEVVVQQRHGDLIVYLRLVLCYLQIVGKSDHRILYSLGHAT